MPTPVSALSIAAAAARAWRRPLALAGACVLVCAPAAASGGSSPASARIHASLRPDRLGAATAVTVSVSLQGSEEPVPPPLRKLAVELPSGLGIDESGPATCTAAALRHGPKGCSARSLVGRGSAVLEVHAGSQEIEEQASMWAFRAPDRGGHPAMVILSSGQTPLDQQAISTAVLTGAGSPYASKLTISIPPIPTVRYEPNASVLSLSLTVGASHPSAVRLTAPRSCPSGGFPFAAQLTFEEGASASAETRALCP